MKSFKSVTALFLVILMTISLWACNSNEDGNTSSGSDVKSNPIKIEDIDWNIDEGIIDGKRYVLLDYTNNTDYTISSFEITFKEKDDLTDEEKENFFTDVVEKFQLSNDDIEQLKEDDISMHAETNHIVNPGESVKNVNCFHYNGSYYVKKIDHYNLVKPNIATIKYIKDDKIYTTYYDFVSEKYSNDDETEVAYQWSKTDLGNHIPKPDVKVVEVEIDDKNTFTFDAYSMSSEQFDAYVIQYQDQGFIVDIDSDKDSYSAENTEGYSVDLYYEKDDGMISVTVEAP